MGGVIGEEVVEGGSEFGFAVGEAASISFAEEFEVSLFLTGDEVMDEHGSAGGEGFVDGSSSGFSDDEVVGGEKLWDALGPPEDFDAAGVGAFHFESAVVEFTEVSSEDDGDGGVSAGVIE